MTIGIILFAHGARDPGWAEPVRRLQTITAERMPKALVEVAFLEHMPPSLEASAEGLIARGVRRLSIIPVFIAQGGHLKADLPRQVAALTARHPAIDVTIAPPIGEVDSILAAIGGWIAGLHPD